MTRAVSAPQFRLAGGGWYETDFKKDGDKKRNLASGEGGEGAKPGLTTQVEHRHGGIDVMSAYSCGCQKVEEWAGGEQHDHAGSGIVSGDVAQGELGPPQLGRLVDEQRPRQCASTPLGCRQGVRTQGRYGEQCLTICQHRHPPSCDSQR